MAHLQNRGDQATSSQSDLRTQEEEQNTSIRHAMPTPVSPIDARHSLSQSDTTTHEAEDLLASSFQSTDTVRRRPEESGESYGSISSHQTPAGKATRPLSPDRPVLRTLNSTRSIHSLRSPLLGPERIKLPRAKKPGNPRRASSNTQGPHRGQEFSVDDDVHEIEGDLATRPALVGLGVTGYGSLRHQPSSLRRRTTAVPTLARVDSAQEEESQGRGVFGVGERTNGIEDEPTLDTEGETGSREIDKSDSEGIDDGHVEDDDISDAESFTLKDRQQAINETHPFGIRIWKPALYKKDRSVQKTAEGDIHSSPGGRVSNWLLFFNMVWTLCFGWWLALVALTGAIVCFIFGAAPGAMEYGRVLWGLSGYLFYPFGKFVRLEQDEAYAHEDQGEGRSITEYEQWQSGDLEDGRLFFGPATGESLVGRRRGRSLDSLATETDSLLGRTRRGSRRDSSARPSKRRLFGRGQWDLGRVIFFLFFYGLITPLLFIVSGICWAMVFWIPMGRITLLLFYHLRRHPLALSFQSDSAYSRGSSNSSILLCTYRAVGLKYWKYTVDGTNIFLINLMAVVVFVIVDYWVLLEIMELHLTITHPAFLFVMALFSIVPLAYFIGQAVASISAQSSMGVGAAINAFFSTIVEVYLYCVALNQGKGQLVEGSIIGSIFAGILFLPGLSMCFGAIKRKTQRFNAKSAGVTSTMLLFAVIAAFGPTLFYQIYGTHELNCGSCIDTDGDDGASPSRDCRRCYFSQAPALKDRFFQTVVQPYCYFAATLLFLSYIIGLWFTLRTHAAVIWNNEIDEKKAHAIDSSQQLSGVPQPSTGVSHGRLLRQPTSNSSDLTRSLEIRDSQLYKKILGQSLKQVGLIPRTDEQSGSTMPSETPSATHNGSATTPHLVPPKSITSEAIRSDVHIPGFSEAENNNLVREVAELAATAATFAAQNVARSIRKGSIGSQSHGHATHSQKPSVTRNATVAGTDGDIVPADAAASGGHDAPNWSRTKSSVILMGATILYALIAEILVNTVDVVLNGVAVDEKFLGITLFALVPNTTEFLNAISFAMNGNIALSMEIGSAYALQVCLLQIPALVAFSAYTTHWVPGSDVIEKTFSLIFPQWDMVTVILCVFLLSYMYGEGKSNYFKGSILLLSYLVVIVGFWFSGQTDMENMGMSRFDMKQEDGTYVTIGRSAAGVAFQRSG